MAAFSYQYNPFLVDSSFFPNNTPIKVSSSFEEQASTNTGLPQPHPHPHHQFQLHQETSSVVTNQDTSCVDQSSKIASSYNTDPSPFVTQNHSPETSTVVNKLENGEQVTQKVTPMEKKRKTTNGSSFNSSLLSQDSTEGRNKKQKKSSGGVKGEDKIKEEKKDQKKGPEEPPTGYIHVRARRGQATDSHSLAERVRREKISERMKMLQRLVPGCDKVTGKALVLDEIINYVQSLQNQVEFLSMKLASLSPLFFDVAMDLDTLSVRPDQKLNSIPSSSTVPQWSPNQAAPFGDTTTMTNIATSFPAANNDYLLDYSSPVFLQGQRSNVFSEYSSGQFWDAEDQRQKLLHPYGFGNNLCSLN